MEDKLIQIFFNVFGISDYEKIVELKKDEIEEWDSISHLDLVQEIEEAFCIEMSRNEIFEIDSFPKALEILKSHCKGE